MKKSFTLFTLALLTNVLLAQAPPKMSCQFVVRNTNGTLVANHAVGVRITVLQGTPGTVVYQEIFNPNPETNANGLVSLEIGTGLPITGSLSAINWGSGLYYLKTETDPTGGTSYSIVGTSQLISVPYAFYAKTAGNGFSGNYNDLTNKPLLFNGTWASLTGKPAFATVATSGSYSDLINKPTIINSQWSSNGSNIYFNTGNVGVGNSNPAEKLDITGNIKVSGDYKYSAAKTDYYHVGCSEFVARNADLGKFVLHGDQEYGAFAGITGTWRAFATVHLPDGAIVNEVRVYYVDCSANNMNVIFRSTSSDGLSRVDLGHVTSTESDPPGAPVARQMAFTPNTTINNSNNRYTLILESAQSDNLHRLYNVRIRYTIMQL